MPGLPEARVADLHPRRRALRRPDLHLHRRRRQPARRAAGNRSARARAPPSRPSAARRRGARSSVDRHRHQPGGGAQVHRARLARQRRARSTSSSAARSSGPSRQQTGTITHADPDARATSRPTGPAPGLQREGARGLHAERPAERPDLRPPRRDARTTSARRSSTARTITLGRSPAPATATRPCSRSAGERRRASGSSDLGPVGRQRRSRFTTADYNTEFDAGHEIFVTLQRRLAGRPRLRLRSKPHDASGPPPAPVVGCQPRRAVPRRHRRACPGATGSRPASAPPTSCACTALTVRFAEWHGDGHWTLRLRQVHRPRRSQHRHAATSTGQVGDLLRLGRHRRRHCTRRRRPIAASGNVRAVPVLRIGPARPLAVHPCASTHHEEHA